MTDDDKYFADDLEIFFFSDWFSNGTFNYTEYQADVSNLDSKLQGYSDIGMQAFLSTTAINIVIFLIAVLTYELLRRFFPNVYASRQEKEDTLIAARQQAMKQNQADGIDDSIETNVIIPRLKRLQYNRLSNLPKLASDNSKPLDWVGKVFGVPWKKVREAVGLDAYFYLRYIRICFKITSVSSIWSALILFPIYATGNNGATGWYYVSMANVSQGSLIIWISMLYIYFFTFFVLFVMKQEYKHFVELRLEFLGKGDGGLTEPQHQYSVMVENIPRELRSDKLLFNYFETLFPGKVHSAKLILKVPKLEALSARKLEVTNALEKSIAFHEATGLRPSHVIGQTCTLSDGIEMDPHILCFDSDKVVHLDNSLQQCEIADAQLRNGYIRVDSISYYTLALQRINDKMFLLQKDLTKQATRGDRKIKGFDKWFITMKSYVDQVVDDLRNESKEEDYNEDCYCLSEDNDRSSISSSFYPQKYDDLSINESQSKNRNIVITKEAKERITYEQGYDESRKKECRMFDNPMLSSSSILLSTSSSSSSVYVNDEPITKSNCNSTNNNDKSNMKERRHSSEENPTFSKGEYLLQNDKFELNPSLGIKQFSSEYYSCDSTSFDKEETQSVDCLRIHMMNLTSSRGWNKLAGRLGFDFGAYMVKIITRRIHVLREEDNTEIVSSTGFVTFNDLATVTCVASAPLTHKPQSLNVTLAPEHRDIIWENCCRRADINTTREFTANMYFILGALLWSIPLVGIQVFASAERLAMLPGFQWIVDGDHGTIKALIDSYLPVVALLTFILILPHIFKSVAIHYECRKTVSDVNRSIVGRYFYYQLANIYVSVTAGSIWISASQILAHPYAALEILGNSLPAVVGYFITLIVTKMLAGLPIVMLRPSALCRYLVSRIRMVHKKKFMTQRELDNVYCLDPVYYGWEYPSQMLVIVICFAYACISPIILIFGAMYFLAALMVYKKQILYVYTPFYESGGDLFPLVCDRTILGLICGQLTFMGYSIVRGGHFFQVILVIPLICFTFWVMTYFRHHYVNPSKRLTLEFAMELDAKIRGKVERRKNLQDPSKISIPQDSFDPNYYRQPVMTEADGEPLFYRIDRQDSMTKEVRRQLKERKRSNLWQQCKIDETV